MTTETSKDKITIEDIRRLLEEGEDSCERNADPGGTVVEFVEEFVEGFFEEVGVEEELELLGRGDEGWILCGDGGGVGQKEFLGDGGLP